MHPISVVNIIVMFNITNLTKYPVVLYPNYAKQIATTSIPYQ